MAFNSPAQAIEYNQQNPCLGVTSNKGSWRKQMPAVHQLTLQCYQGTQQHPQHSHIQHMVPFPMVPLLLLQQTGPKSAWQSTPQAVTSSRCAGSRMGTRQACQAASPSKLPNPNHSQLRDFPKWEWFLRAYNPQVCAVGHVSLTSGFVLQLAQDVEVRTTGPLHLLAAGNAILSSCHLYELQPLNQYHRFL